MSKISKLQENLIIKKIDSDTVNISVNDNEMLMAIVGQFDQNLKSLSKLTDTDIYFRGNSITCKGDEEKLSVFIKQTDDIGTVLTATQSGKRKKFSFKQLMINFFMYPLMSLKIISAIHFEALLLWKKGAIYRKRKNKILNNLSYEEY